MAEVPVTIPPDAVLAALVAAEAAAEVPAAGDKPVAPAEEVSWVLSLYRGSLRGPLLKCGMCRFCFHGVCRLTSLFS